MIDNGIVPQYLRQVRTDFPQIPVGTSQRSNFWLSDARAEQLDQYGVDTSSPFNYHFGLIEAAGKPKGILF
jgi:hypothetical protein